MIEVHISLSDMLLINEAMKKADDNEIGGFGTIMYTDEGVPYVNHLYIPKQTISGSEVDWGMDGVLDFINFLNEQGDMREYRGIFSWHSHNNMGCFWSSTDEKFIALAGSEGVPYVFSAVFNNKGDSLTRLDVFPKTNCGLIEAGYIQVEYDDDSTNLNVYESKKITERRAEVDEIKEAMDAEIKAIEDAREKEIEEVENSFSEDIEAAKKHVHNMTNSLRGDAKKHVEEIWDERISEAYDFSSWETWKWDQFGRNNRYTKDGYNYSSSRFTDGDLAIGSGIEEISDIVAEIGEDIMFYTYDQKDHCFKSMIYAEDEEWPEISIAEAKFAWVDVWDLIGVEIKNVSVYDYLMSNYDMDDQEGEYELVTASNSSFEREFQAANAASLK